MKRTRLLSLALVLLATAGTALAQQPPPAQPAPPAGTAPPPAVAPGAPAAFPNSFSFNFGDNFLGVSVEEVTRENVGRYRLSGEPRGVGVRSVVKGSPAERAGLREGDVIVRFDGEAVTSVRKLNRLIEESAPRHAARLTVLRGGSEQQISATLGRREGFHVAPAEFGFDAEAVRRFAEETAKNSEQWRRQGEQWKQQGEQWKQQGEQMRRQLEQLNRERPGAGAFSLFGGRRIGVTTSGLGRQLADFFGVPHGVLVNSVEENSPAAKAGLRAGDVITEADGQKVEDSDDLSGAIGRREEGEVTLTVIRDKKSRTVRVTPERRQPQGLFSPGSFRLGGPVATVRAPRPVVAPRALVAPRAITAPRVRPVPRVIAPRAPEGRIL